MNTMTRMHMMSYGMVARSYSQISSRLSTEPTGLSLPARQPFACPHAGAQFAHAVNPRPHLIAGLDSRAFGTAGRKQIAGLEREVVAVKRHQIERAHLHIAHEIARTNAVIVPGDDFKSVYIRHFI